MVTSVDINAAFASIPTVDVAEVTRIKTSRGEFDAHVMFDWGSSVQYSYTDTDGVIWIVRIKN